MKKSVAIFICLLAISYTNAQSHVKEGSVFVLETYLEGYRNELHSIKNDLNEQNEFEKTQRRIEYNTEPTVGFKIERISNDTLYTTHKIGEHFSPLDFDYKKENNLYFSSKKMKFSPFGRKKRIVSIELATQNKIILRTYNKTNEIEGIFEYKLTYVSRTKDNKFRKKYFGEDGFPLFKKNK